PVYHYNWYGRERYEVAADKPLPSGKVALKLVFDYDGGTSTIGKGGLARILVNGEETAQGHIEKTVDFVFSISGEGLDVGQDTGSQVGPYERGFPFTGKIDRVEVDFRSTLDAAALAALQKGRAEVIARAE
ncbi:MAG: hypothetical protein LBO79_06455, partial [Zoogloeaceae bacterium]|nr:hypothetical protein [Zoogloeaceae bacterium]